MNIADNVVVGHRFILTKIPKTAILRVLLLFSYKTKFMEDRDINKAYSKEEFVSKLRRLADCIEKNENFRISVAGEALYVPDKATFSIEHERSEGSHELEFQVKWED
jgi:amphi-Trp domain-containing protein